MRALLAIAGLLITACIERPSQPIASAETGCVVDLALASEQARVTFLRDNAAAIVEGASTGAAWLASDPDLPEMKLVSDASCASFDRNHSGLRIPPDVIMGENDLASEDAAQLVGALQDQDAAFDQDTSRPCVVRISPVPETNLDPIMGALGGGGLRSAFVFANTDGLFAAYGESCDLVQSHVEATLAAFGRSSQPANLCANASLRQCGFTGAMEVE